MLRAVKNSSGNFDVESDGDQLGEIVVADTWTGEPLFEHTSTELLDLSDMVKIIQLMKSCARSPSDLVVE